MPINRRHTACTAAAMLLFSLAGTDVRLEAAPVSQEQALEAAYAWLSLTPDLMHEQHGRLAGTVTAVHDALGQPEYYAIDLAPSGYVIVAADDTVEPVIAFSATDVFQPVQGNPLYDMLRSDVPNRLSRARSAHLPVKARWQSLRTIANEPKVLTQTYTASGSGISGVSSINDVRVAPLTKTKWDQLTSYGQPVYNYYTPPYSAGNPNNYWTGCVATMLGQIMRYHQWPQSGVGTASFQITVNNHSQQRSLRGGDGAGGSYDWADMPGVASQGMPAAQMQAISALLADAGVASNMDYESDSSGASIRASVLTNVFQYADAAFSNAQLSDLEVAIDSNLDAGLPVGLGITGGGVGHAVVADGYGYNGSTLYHHINLGWSGSDNAWYNLPTINVGFYDFTVVNGALFNIDPLVKGEIVSGRIVDKSGKPVPGVQVTVASGSVTMTATTNAVGIYAVKGLASNTTCSIKPSADGWAFSPASLSVTTGHSSSNGGVGDKTGLDFTSQLLTGSVSVQINAGAVADGAEWRVGAGAWQPSGAILSEIPIGTQTISYRDIKAWQAPPDQAVTVNENQTTSVTANYVPQYSLTAVPDNASDGQVSANPQPGEMGSYAPGTSVTLTATPSSGYYFGGWLESGTLVSTDASYTSVVTSARQLVASFPPDTLTGEGTQVYVTSSRSAANINVLASLDDTAGTLTILSVTQPANGTVTINSDGTLTFTPGKSFHGSTQFSYSAGDGRGGSITEVVTISNLYAASAGTYAGLSIASDVTNESSGYLKVTLGSSGAFSGRLSVAGISYGLSGAFDDNGNYSKVIARKNASSLSVALHLIPASEITGTVDDGTTTSEITAARVTFSSKNKASLAGRYTALLAGNDAVPGNGFLVVTVSPTGAATAAGRLADGTPVSVGAYLNEDGSVPYYAGVYKSGTGAGSVLGIMTVQAECTGTYAWFRPASAGVYYPGGFATSGTMTGSLVPAVTSANALENPQSSIAAQLSGGNLVSEIDENGELSGGKITWTTSNPASLTLSISASGEVTGSFIDPLTGKRRAVLGVWIANQQLGGGFFLGESTAGAMTLSGP